MQIVTIEMNLKAVNKSIALFNCEKKVSGVIHSNSTGETTVVLDGGYVLGKFDCPHCAVEAISLLTVKVSDGDKGGLVITAVTSSITQKDFIRPSIKKTPTEAGVPCPALPTKANRTYHLVKPRCH
ncbi:hypothetical protein CISEMA079M_07555 [Citrobacter sedlakii]